jgi:hypothetical protein
MLCVGGLTMPKAVHWWCVYACGVPGTQYQPSEMLIARCQPRGECSRAKTHKRACPNRSMNGRMKKRRRGAWMSAVSSGRCVVGGWAITRAYET